MEEILGQSGGGTKPYNDINLPTNHSDKITKREFQGGGANRTMDNIEYINNNNNNNE